MLDQAPPSRSRLTAIRREVVPLVRLAVPLVIGLAMATILGVTDTLMIAPLGTVPLAAVSLVSTVIVVFYAAHYGFLSVIGVEIAEAFGAGDPRRIASAIRNGLVVGGLIGVAGAAVMMLILVALPYTGQPPEVLAVLAPYAVPMALLLIPFSLFMVLKQLFDAVDRPWLSVGFASIAVAVNIPLNWWLIYGGLGLPALGLLGAGLASLAAETIGFAAAALYWRYARATRRLRVRSPVEGRLLRSTSKEGAPLGVGALCEAGAYSLAGLMLGWFGAAALAANQVVNAVVMVLYMLPLGMAAAVAIRIGQAAGAGETDRLRPIAVASLGLVTLWMLGITGSLVLGGATLAGLMASDAEVAAIATAMFIVVAIMQVADGIQSTALGMLRGLRDTRWPTLVSIGAYWGLALPASYIFAFPLGFGPPGIWLGFGVGLSVAAILLPWRFWRTTRGK